LALKISVVSRKERGEEKEALALF